MSSTKRLKFEILYKINKLVDEYHDENIIKKNNSQITLLYNDGEIVETKGGDKFFKRTMFTKYPKLNNVNFKMPIEHGRFSYCILPSIEIGELIRSHMKML